MIAYIDAHRDRFGVEPICRVQRQIDRRRFTPADRTVLALLSRAFDRVGARKCDRVRCRTSDARNRYKIRYTRNQDRLAPLRVNAHDRVSGTHRVDSGVVEDLPRPWTQRGGGRARRVRRGRGGIPRSDCRLRGAVRVGKAPLPSTAGPAVAVVGSSARRCGAAADATACRG